MLTISNFKNSQKGKNKSRPAFSKTDIYKCPIFHFSDYFLFCCLVRAALRLAQWPPNTTNSEGCFASAPPLVVPGWVLRTAIKIRVALNCIKTTYLTVFVNQFFPSSPERKKKIFVKYKILYYSIIHQPCQAKESIIHPLRK